MLPRGLSLRNAAGWISGAAGVLVFVWWWFGDALPQLWVLALIAAVIGGALWAWDALLAHRHSREVREFALTHGWEYTQRSYGYGRRFNGHPFGVGTKQRQEDIITGTFAGLRCATFTHRYEFRTSRDDSASVKQAFQITLAELDMTLPRLDLVPESFGTRAWQLVGGGDIDLESAAFNRAWHVVCSDRRYAVNVLEPRMMERLMQPDALGYAIRIDAGAVFIWQPDPQGIADLSRRLSVVTSIAKRIPPHVARPHEEAERQRRAEQAAREAAAPTWANTPGVLNSRRYTGIGSDDEGEGIDNTRRGTR